MNRYLFLWLALGLLSVPSASVAAVFERNWQVPGDGLLTFDNVNRREWLDLSETLLERFPGESLEAKYQNVVGELVPGGIFDSFVVAKSADVIALAQSAGINTSTDNYDLNHEATIELIDLLSPTLTYSTGRVLAIGFLDEIDDVPSPFLPRLASFLDDDPPGPGNNGDSGLKIGSGSDAITSATTGVMLFRRVVPEPSSSVLVVTMFGLVVARSFCRRKSLLDPSDLV